MFRIISRLIFLLLIILLPKKAFSEVSSTNTVVNLSMIPGFGYVSMTSSGKYPSLESNNYSFSLEAEFNNTNIVRMSYEQFAAEKYYTSENTNYRIQTLNTLITFYSLWKFADSKWNGINLGVGAGTQYGYSDYTTQNLPNENIPYWGFNTLLMIEYYHKVLKDVYITASLSGRWALLHHMYNDPLAIALWWFMQSSGYQQISIGIKWRFTGFVYHYED